MRIERGDVFLAELDPTRGSEIQKTRPVVVVTNDIANEYSRLITVVPISSQRLDRVLTGEVVLGRPKGLDKPSKALIQQMRALDKARLIKKLSTVTPAHLGEIDEALKVHLALT